jgi:hypothetical protein
VLRSYNRLSRASAISTSSVLTTSGSFCTRPAAEQWHRDAIEAGDALIWTISEDHHNTFVAKAYSAKADAPCDFMLTAPTIEDVRGMLPMGLTRLSMANWEGRAVVREVWI